MNVVVRAICGKSIASEASFDGIASINLGTISPESTDISIHIGICCASCSVVMHLDDILSTIGLFFSLFSLSKLDYDINWCSIKCNSFALCHFVSKLLLFAEYYLTNTFFLQVEFSINNIPCLFAIKRCCFKKNSN